MKTPAHSRRTDKSLLIINIVAFIAALIVGILDVSHREYIPALAMLGVMVITAFNSFGCWRRLKGKI
ncbi:hypothetical protein FQ707_00520 [Bacteroidaceae bacterium HV4-6-C5C]|jgi:hypothetical protein|nr:hypothetical protein FQ707_00520 [Bacteroidaceae bacterium HV4-6-C5C]